MALTASTMLPLGTKAPDFSLPSTEGGTVALEDFGQDVLVVIFMCNHCPFVQHVSIVLADLATDYMQNGVDFVGISANDIEQHPEDDLEHMKVEKEEKGYPFPYLYDETQEVAKAYSAACTPDIFVFDKDRKLVYRGQFDETRPEKGTAHGGDLKAVLDVLLEGKEIPSEQHPSTGCNIKWKPGNEPEYFTHS